RQFQLYKPLGILTRVIVYRYSTHKNGDPHMTKKELEQRTKKFALRVIAFVSALPNERICDVLGYQLLKAGTSVGGNYREANRAQSRNDFIHKIAIVEKESAESEYWLELFNESNI